MVEQLIQMLHRTELGLDEPLSAIEIADIIWLATHLRSKQRPTQTIEVNSNKESIFGSEEQEQNQPQFNPNKNNTEQEPTTSEPVVETKDEEVSVISESNSAATSSGSTIPISVPAATAIPHRRAISRALRPLNRKVPSRTKKVLDRDQTITQSAEEEFCIPVLKPALQRWLDVVLIVETSPAYGIWQKTIKEFKNLLLLQGIFRDVKCWYANFEGDRLVFRSQQGSIRSPKELIILTGDRLILILSDCVSSAWYSDAWSDWIKYWGKYHPVTVLQMLPSSFWRRTALGQMDSVWLNSKMPGWLNRPCNQASIWNRESATPWDDEEISEAFPLPIVTLDPYALEVWAKGISGTSSTELAGVDLQALDYPGNNSTSSVTPESSEQLFEQFMATASSTARRLAALLSAVPIQLPIIRLVQRSLLAMDSNAVHVAEIFFSGILHKIKDHQDPEKRLYDFEPELRAKFRQTLPKQEIINVIDRISIYIARRVGVSLNQFRAMLFIPADKLNSPLAEEINEFARISKETLQGLGKEYADFVANLAANHVYNSDLEIVLQKFTYNVATVEVKLEFNVVTLVPKEQVKYQLSSTEIELIERHNSELSRWGQSRYQSYKQLKDTDYRIETHQGTSDAVIIAPHGGKIEPGATEIAKAIAGEDHSYYSLEGLKPGNNHHLSIPSDKFDEPFALKIIGQANRVIAIHVFFDSKELVYIGGLDTDLRKKIEANLKQEEFKTIKPGYNFESENINNICNRGKTEKGVNIGIARGLLQKLLNSLKSEDSNEPTLYHRFIQAIRDALSPLEAAGWQCQVTQGQADFYTEELAEGVELDMISIPGGSFIMGSPADETDSYDDERPQHQVTVPSFYMGRYPITQAQWQAVMGNNPAKFQDNPLNPVEQVSWDDAQQFCDRLSRKTGKEYRLPTEAEWEYACRASTETPFHFGETISTELANYDGSYTYKDGVEGVYREQTTPVGYFKVANNFGLSDMHGNVWEWCEDDWHENYRDAPNDRSTWVSEKTRVVRGGSWIGTPDRCRSAYRFDASRDGRVFNIGFRIVCVVSRTI